MIVLIYPYVQDFTDPSGGEHEQLLGERGGHDAKPVHEADPQPVAGTEGAIKTASDRTGTSERHITAGW